METFTPQQRQGGPHYGGGVLIGSHYEETFQATSALVGLVARANAGALKTTRWQERVAEALEPVELTRARQDGCIHFGDVLQLVHAPTGGALAVTAHEADASCAGEPDACRASVTGPGPSAAPVARTALTLSKFCPLRPSPLERQWEGDIVRFGQRLHVTTAPKGGEPLFLASHPATPACAARYSRHQPVVFARAPSYAAVWQPEPVAPAIRGALEGQPVAPGVPFVLVHCATATPLHLEMAFQFPCDFGSEFEVSAHHATSKGMQQGLERLAKGDGALAALPKQLLQPNHWAFVNGGTDASATAAQLAAPDAQSAADSGAFAGVVPLLDPDQLLLAIAADVAAQSGGLAALDRKLLLLCRRGQGRGDVEAGELLLALRQCGARGLGEAEAAALVAEFAGSGPGLVAGHVLAATLMQRAQQQEAAGQRRPHLPS